MGDSDYHPLYLRGIEQFNRRDYFGSHETWESLWIGQTGPGRQFYKGLIQAAVALHHLSRGNAHGAAKLLAGSQRYLRPYRPRFLGLDVDAFLAAVERCAEDGLALRPPRMTPGLIPSIDLHPPAPEHPTP